ncbi:Protein cms1 [Saitoella coloradoensis]
MSNTNKRQRPVSPGGDDLDDGLEYAVDDDFDAADALPTGEDDGDDVEPAETPDADADDAKKLKRKRDKEKRAVKKRMRLAEDAEAGQSSVGVLDPQLQADFVSKKIKAAYPTLSSIELDEKMISAKAFVDTVLWGEKRSLETLHTFVQKFSVPKAKLNESSETNGSPHTIFLGSAALRVADLTRALRVYKTPTSGVAKLFAKHMKLAEHVKFVSENRLGFGVGTPNRVLALIQQDALKVDHMQRIFIDASWKDAKQRSIWDMQECWKEVVSIICHPEILERLKDGKTKIVFF